MSVESQSRFVSWVSPGIFEEAVRSGRYRTGLDLLQAILRGELPRPPIAELLDYGPTLVEDGRTVFELMPRECHYNPLGVVHGGVAATLCDTAMGCAVHTKLPLTVSYTTLELKVNYVRPITVRTGNVRCVGEVVHLGSKTATADSRLFDGQDRLLAHATTTCLILR